MTDYEQPQSSHNYITINRQVIKRVSMIQQKVVERIVQIPKIVEIERIVERIIPVEVEKIVEIPIMIEVPVEKEVQILKIIEVTRCCCGESREVDGQQVLRLMEELAEVKKTLHEMVKGCSEEVSFIRESKEMMDIENQQLKNQVAELQQTIKNLQQQLQQRNQDVIRQQTMEISQSLCLSEASLQEQFVFPSEMSQTPIFSKRAQTDQSLLQISLNQSAESRSKKTSWRPFCTLKQFVNGQNYDQGILLLLVIKLVQQVECSIKKGQVNFHKPSTIIIGYDNFGNVQVTLGEPIQVKQPLNQPYFPPQALQGAQTTEKSCVFNIGAIWDELLHSTTYFRCGRDILNMANEYKIRDKSLNPLLMNVLYSMLSKTSKQRPTLKQTLRLLKTSLLHLNQANSSSNAPLSDRTYE